MQSHPQMRTRGSCPEGVHRQTFGPGAPAFRALVATSAILLASATQMASATLIALVAFAGSASATPGAWSPEVFGPLDRPPALRPVGQPSTVLTREAFLTPRPRAPYGEMAAAWDHVDAGRLAEAEEAFERLQWNHESDGRGAVGAALSRLLSARPLESLPLWRDLLGGEEPEAIAYVSLGWMTRLRVADARTRLHEQLPLTPRPAESQFLMAVCDTLLGDYRFAEGRLAEIARRGRPLPSVLALGSLVQRLATGTLAEWAGTRSRRGWVPPPASAPGTRTAPGWSSTRRAQALGRAASGRAALSPLPIPPAPAPDPLPLPAVVSAPVPPLGTPAVALAPATVAAAAPAGESPLEAPPLAEPEPEAELEAALPIAPAPTVGPDYARLSRRLAEAAKAVNRFENRLNEQLAPAEEAEGADAPGPPDAPATGGEGVDALPADAAAPAEAR